MALFFLASCASDRAPLESGPPACAVGAQAAPRALWGRWEVRWTEAADTGAATETLHLYQHPEWSHSLHGHIDRPEGRLLLAGDWEDGDLQLEESVDGKAIRATWQGRLTVAQPAARIEGLWVPDASFAAAPASARRFALVRAGC